jgi:class 3 adenylate cyclase
MRLTKGLKDFACPCGENVSLVEPKERLAKEFPSQVHAMDTSADRSRDFDAFIVSANGETRTQSFTEWAGGERVTLAIVFTDVVGSTALEFKIGGERMTEVRRAHFRQGRKLLSDYHGREVKTIGDSFMAAFRTVEDALDFALAFRSDTGDSNLRIRAGVHVGPMLVEGNDVFGGPVNFAARVVAATKNPEIWLSDRAKEDIDTLRARRHGKLKWDWHTSVALSGFPGTFTLWSLNS